MENSWQIKCGSSTQPMASSTSLETRNQREMDSGYCFYPHGTHGLRSSGHDSSVPNMRIGSSCRQGNAELGNSFLALLSAPPSLLQCDFKEQSNLKSFSASSSKLPFDGGFVISTSVGSGVPPIANGLPSECQSNQNGPSPIFSSRVVANSNCSTKYGLHDGLETVNVSLQSSDLAKAIIHQLVSSNERAKDFSSIKGKWHNTSLGHAAKIPSSCIPISHKEPLQSNSSLPCQPSACTSQCPRVICLGASGNLLLSNTGLLGIVCSCHHFHTSVAKFCEHLGLYDVNPGDAVRMESGETIAQWRKLYFRKFGIRVPDDQTGWDWPEALSAPAGLVKSSVAASNMPNYSDLAKLVSSSGGLIKRGQPWDSIVYPKNPYTDKNSVIDAFRDKDQSNSRESTNLVMECQTSRCSTSSKFADSGPDGGLQSIHAYIDSFLKSGDPCITNPAQNSRTYNENYDVSKIKNACDPVIAERVATSSNIELRLGQPYQQGQSSGNSVPLVTEPKLLDTVVAQPRSLFLEQMTNNAANCGERVALRQKFQCSAGPANLSARNVSNLNIGRHVFGISNVTDTTKLDKFDGNVTKTSMVPSLAHVSTAPEMNANSKANNHMVSSDHIIPKSVHCEPYSAKSNPVRVPWTVDGSERQLNVSELGFFRIKDKGKGVGCTADVSYAKIDSVSNIEEQLESRCTCPVAMGGSKDPCSSVVHDKIYYSHQSSGVPPDAFDARNLFNYPEKVPSLGSSRHTDHLFLTSKGSPWGSSQLLQSQAVSMASPLATSASMQGMAPAISTLEGTGVSPYLLDDNMRFLALRQIVELSKQQQAISSLGMDQETGRTSNFSNVNIRPLVGPSAFGEQTPGPNITSQRDSSAVAMLSPTSSAYTKLGVNIEKSSPIADLNNSCEFSTWICGNPLLSREIDLQCQFPHDPPSNKQLPLRSEHISSSIENAKCYPGVSCTYFQGHCSCTAYSKCSGGNCESRIGNAPNTFKDQVGNVNGVTPTLVASEFVKDGTDLKEKIISSDQRAKVTGQVCKSNVCHASQWKDVPSKYKGVSTVACLDLSAEDLLDGRGNIDGQLGDATSKCSYGTMKIRDSLKEQEMSNISSGCSAAAVIHTSVQGNNLDSTTPDVGNARYINKHIVDEGSGIDKCWSSDDALESERSAEFRGSNCKTNLSTEGSSKNINNLSSRSLLDELKLLNSLTWKKNRKQTHTRLAVNGKINFKKIERGVKTGKKKRARKIKMLVPQCPTGGPSTVPYEYPKGTDSLPFSSEDVEMRNPSFQETCISGACSLKPISKCGRSLSSSKELFRKRDLHMIYDDSDGNDYQIEANPCKIHEFSGMKEFGRVWTSDCTRKSQMAEPTHVHTKDGVRCRSFGCMKALSSGEVNICSRKARPVVCGKYGEICNELIGDVSRPAKIVPLSRILKTSRRDTLPNTCDSKQTFPDELKKTIFCGSDAGYNGFSNLRKEEESAIHHSSICNEMNVDLSLEEDEKMFTNGVDEENSMLEKKIDHKSKKNCSKLNRKVYTKTKPKSKEIRKRSLCELTDNGKKSTSESFSLVKISKCMPKMEVGKVSKNAVGSKHNIRASSEVNSEKLNPEHVSLSVMDSDAFCRVCGGSNKDEINCLIECSRCFIKVHQACYGVSKVPKGHWYCRPCRTNSRDIVCVLCGYGGGAMTCALRSRTIVKGLLKAWNIETDSKHKNAVSSAQIMEDDLNLLHSSGPMLESSMLPVSRPVNTEPLSTAAWKMDFPNQLDVLQKSSGNANNVKVHNSITAGAFDSTVKQWVHMVCGLWTPGTRCPNVDTMSAFDVSGASHPKANVVCSICNRPGGSCIQCRVVNCSVKFHPWCAHQKGLLQSEVEGAENESVGFYGRCVLHATHPLCESGSDPFDIEVVCSIEKEFTCARTEGYKGRKRDGFWHNLHGQSRGKSACLVPQEQLNAWIHINGQKSSTNGLPKLTVSDVEYDCRKEYARYKQMKGWKHLVVYKSGIHALGLYTSRFISRGEMVVEYVGEIVGLRVADKREIEYQSGRKLQYKSACYFFRIDKEHIIDATCKGGIARFVNHSCLPNCVAKVISVRNEKKVVFFAERDIYPGEEITYDYHFNHEDEGKKIPCFCNSKNCRRYLN